METFDINFITVIIMEITLETQIKNVIYEEPNLKNFGIF